MARMYIKLDHDWLRDPKVRNFRKKAGKPALVDLVQLYILMARNKGRVDIKDYGQKEDALDVLAMSEKKMMSFLDLVADCEIINAEMWQSLQVITSKRAVDDYELSHTRKDAGVKGGHASGESRRTK
ncbi:MAG: DUF4373 domain-containing protein [Eggerthellaceae bacterium]|nr:DUF4373 domain-containing protein [Eggerthellaceae bacterium]